MDLDTDEEVPQVFVALTPIDPATVPQFTVTDEVPCPEAMVTLVGFVQLYVNPAIEVVL